MFARGEFETRGRSRVDVARAKRDEAPKLIAALRLPFEMNRHGSARRLALIELAAEYGDFGTCAATVGEFEPEAPWNERFLANRSACYAKVSHPLAKLANDEWMRFRARGAEPLVPKPSIREGAARGSSATSDPSGGGPAE